VTPFCFMCCSTVSGLSATAVASFIGASGCGFVGERAAS
jgi:hypothetical protein